MKYAAAISNTWMPLAICALLGCDSAGNMSGNPAPGIGGKAGTGTAGVGASGNGGAKAGSPGSSGTGATAGTVASSAGITGGAGTTAASGTGGAGGSGASGSGAAGSDAPTDLAPQTRDAKYASLTPPLGEPLPAGSEGTWTYTDVEGALSRDGSPAGFYYKRSKTGNKNLMVYLAGGGVCADSFFCNMNPPNKTASLTAENVGTGVFNIFGPDQEMQDPSGERWQSGIFKDDPANPVKDWNMVFIPYVTGDVFFGSKPNGTVPEVPGEMFQFVGKANMLKFLGRMVPTFKDAKIVLLTGSSAGGIGALLNYTYYADSWIDQGMGARVLVINDAGPFFDDEHLEVCLQQRYRTLYGLNDSLPKDCEGCFNADGGGMAKGVLQYLEDKYPGDLVLGGIVDSSQDEIMKFFFSEGLENCSFIDNPIFGLLAYPADRYPAALKHILNDLVDPKRINTYVWEGDLHQNLFQTATDDRYYQMNGLEKTVAQWVGTMLTGQSERIGVFE